MKDRAIVPINDKVTATLRPLTFVEKEKFTQLVADNKDLEACKYAILTCVEDIKGLVDVKGKKVKFEKTEEFVENLMRSEITMDLNCISQRAAIGLTDHFLREDGTAYEGVKLIQTDSSDPK